jgi:hypothetical protein
LNVSVIHLVGQRLTPELAAVARELRTIAVVYHFGSTRELIAAWRMARANDAAERIAPTAVVWLQSRPGEFRQREIDVVTECDPLVRTIVIAGCWLEGEPRSGKPLTGVTRSYWHQGIGPLLPIITRSALIPTVSSQWIAIHTPQLVDYQGLAANCQTLGLQTIWQSDRGAVISSEPAIRLFVEWETWRAWRLQQGAARPPRARDILLLSFPRPEDFERAAECGISQVVALPFTAADLQRAVCGGQRARNTTLSFERNSQSKPVTRGGFVARQSA